MTSIAVDYYDRQIDDFFKRLDKLNKKIFITKWGRLNRFVALLQDIRLTIPYLRQLKAFTLLHRVEILLKEMDDTFERFFRNGTSKDLGSSA